jgi:hypothetical protein
MTATVGLPPAALVRALERELISSRVVTSRALWSAVP